MEWYTKHGDKLPNGQTLGQERDAICSSILGPPTQHELMNKAESTKVSLERVVEGSVVSLIEDKLH